MLGAACIAVPELLFSDRCTARCTNIARIINSLPYPITISKYGPLVMDHM